MGAIDTSSELGARAEERLRTEKTIWLATVDSKGRPTVRPVWFLWNGGSFLVYSSPTAAKLRDIALNPNVCLHLDPDEWGENVVVVFGQARIAPEQPPADESAAYVAKYDWGFERLGLTTAEFARVYSAAIAIRFTGLRTYL